MKKLKELLWDEKYIKASLFLILTAVLLYAVYLLLANLGVILKTFLAVLSSVASALTPLWVGLVLAYLISPLADLINKKVVSRLFSPVSDDPFAQVKREKQARRLAILLTFLLLLAAVAAVIYAFFVLIMGQLVFTSLDSMIESILSYFNEYEEMLGRLIKQLPDSGLEIKLQELVSAVTGWFSRNFNASAIIDRLTGLGGSMLDLVLGVVVCIYLLTDREFFLGLWRKSLHFLLPMEQHAKLSEALHDMDTVISQFLRGQLVDGLIIAILSSIGLTLLKLNFAVFIGCFAGACNIIPYFGPIMGMVPAAAVGLLSGSPVQAVSAVLVLFLIQQADSAFISPRVVGKSIGLHPVFVLLSVTLGGAYFGVIGMLLSVPAAAILKLFFVRKISSL